MTEYCIVEKKDHIMTDTSLSTWIVTGGIRIWDKNNVVSRILKKRPKVCYNG